MLPRPTTEGIDRDRGSAAEGRGAPPGRPGSGEEGVDLAELFAMLRERWYWMALGAMLVGGLVSAKVLLSRPVFDSHARLYLGEVHATTKSVASLGVSGDSSDIGSELEILNSRFLLKQAVLESGANALVLGASEEPVTFWQWLMSGRDPSLVDTGARRLVARQATLAPERVDPVTFGVKFMSDDSYEVYLGESLLGSGTLGQPFIGSDLGWVLSGGSGPAPTCGELFFVSVLPLEQAVDIASEMVVAYLPPSKLGDPSKVVTLEMTDVSPERAKRLVTALMQAYLTTRQRWKTEDATAAESFVSQQLASMRDSLGEMESKVADFRSANQEVVLDNEADAMVAQLAKIEEQRVAARLEVSSLSNIRRALGQKDAPIEAFLVGESHDSVLQRLAESLSTARRELDDLRTRFQDGAPSVVEQQAQVAAQLTAIRNYVHNRLSRANEHLRTLNGLAKGFENKLSKIPGAELHLAKLSREAEVYDDLYSYLLEQKQQAAIAKASRVSQNRVLDQPRVARMESGPNLNIALLSVPLGALLGALGVLVWGLMRGVLHGEGEVLRKAGLPVFARVPHVRHGAAKQPVPIFDPQGGRSDFRFVEAIRTLRTNLYAAKQEGVGQVVLVTSAGPDEGKTTCALALVSMLAADGKRALIIDIDIRKPTQQLLVGAKGGLTEVLRGNVRWSDAAQPVAVASGGFYALGVQASESAELLTSERMQTLLARLRRHFDYIVLDAAPCPLVSDAIALAPQADCVLSVVRLRHTRRAAMMDHLAALRDLRSAHALVINDARASGAYAGYSTYGEGGIGVGRKPARVTWLRPRAVDATQGPQEDA